MVLSSVIQRWLSVSALALLATACGADGAGVADDGGLTGLLNGSTDGNGGTNGDASATSTGGDSGTTSTASDGGATTGTAGTTGDVPTTSGGSTSDGGTTGDNGGTTGDNGGTTGDGGHGGDQPSPGTLIDLPFDGELTSLCYEPSECNGDDLLCFRYTDAVPGHCVEDCNEDSDCEAVDGIAPSCNGGRCIINCAGEELEGDGPCPDDMECRDLPTENVPGVITPVWVDALNPNFWCVYPADAGTNDVPKLGKCDLDHVDGDCEGDRACHMPGLPANAHGYCADRCDTASDCTGADDVSSTPVCAAGECEYDCSGPGATCPSGMNCRDILPGTWRCRYID